MSENNVNVNASATSADDAAVQSRFKKRFCKYCGNEIPSGSAFCPSCGKPQGNASVQQIVSPTVQQPQPAMSPTAGNNSSTTVIVQERRSNGIGTAGFVFALLAFLVCWIPIVDIIVWFLGALLSFIGLFKAPRGLAITGFILSFIGIIILVTVFGALIGFAAK